MRSIVKIEIRDWAGNSCFMGRTFNSYDDAETFLEEKLGNDWEEHRQEYELEEVPNLKTMIFEGGRV